MEYLNTSETLKVLQAAKDIGPREHAMILLAYRHALRASEVCALALSDVRDGKIRCKRLKNSLSSVEPLESHLNPLLDEPAVLAAWLKYRGDADGTSFLFTSRQGSGLRRRQLHNVFAAIASDAGIDVSRAHMHCLKHTAAMHLFEAGVDVFTMQKRLGHRDVKSTASYVHVTVDQAAAAAAKAADKLFAA